MMRCADLEDDLVPHLRGELDALRDARVDAHLQHCGRCARSTSALADALAAGRAWEPEVSAQELTRMSAGLAGLVPAPRAAGLRALAVGLAAAAATLLVVWVGRGGGPAVLAIAEAPGASPVGHEIEVVPVSRVMRAPSPPTTSPAAAAIAAAPARVEVRRARWTAGLRAVSSGEWDGSLVHSPSMIDVYATRGFAVIALEDGARPLRVRTEDGELEVDGRARLFVEVMPGQPTTVGVIAGRARWESEGQRVSLVAGQTLQHAGRTDAGALRSQAFHADPFLGRGGGASAAAVARRGGPDRTAAAMRPALHGVTDLVAEAEDLARAGRLGAAEARLVAGLRDTGDRRAGAILRFELARLVARDPARRAEAIRLLDALVADGRGEPSIQAAILRCELELGRDRCAARRCLEAVAPRAPEARRLLERSQLTHELCGS